MKVRLLGLAVVLVALAVIVNALAISSADVTNKVTVSVVGSKDALLAFDTTGADDQDLAVSGTSGGQMTITIDDGIQRNSNYTFSPAFKITNNSDYPLNLTIDDVVSNGVTVSASAVSTTAAPGTHGSFTALPPTKSVWVALTFDADGTATTPSVDLVVHAER